MPYITIKQHQKPYQITFEDALFGTIPVNSFFGESSATGTITRKVDNIGENVLNQIRVPEMIEWLEAFNERHKDLFEADRNLLYSHFKIPKKTGGLRQIDAPCDELQNALRELVVFLKDTCGCLYHTAAFAYVEKRSTIDCVRKHVEFKSQWYLKTDISGFFPSTTLEFTMKMLCMIFPLSEIVKVEQGKEALEKAISLGFLNGGLPQGTVLSPFLTNVMFIPIDHYLFGEFSSRKMVYTRYADDMHISAQEKFPYQKMVDIIKEAFRMFDAPYEIKEEKTHFGSYKGKNWILGVVSNSDFNITVGYRNKARMKGCINNFILDTLNENPWDITDVMHMNGLLSYYKMVEKDYFDMIIRRTENKYHVNFNNMVKNYLNA